MTTAPAHKELKISPEAQDNPLIKKFALEFAHGELKTPSFPDAAFKIRKAIEQDCETEDLVKIVNMDSVISAKLIQIVNSPFYMPMMPISNCFDAINRLGRKTTRDLVTIFSMKNLIRSDHATIKKLIQQAWLQSVKVSSISFILAKLIKSVDPNEALLAGLLHNIGVLPILSFADKQPSDSYQPGDIDLCIDEVQGQVGTFILEEWEFPESLKPIPLLAAGWQTDGPGKFGLIDIIILAKYHFLLDPPGNKKLPQISALPSYQKLEDAQLTPEMSLQILHDARLQVADAMKFFSG